MTDPTICISCRNTPADQDDRQCPKCRADNACQGLTEMLTDAVEIFFDDRWAPHRFGQRPSYYLTEPAFDDLTYHRIKTAYDQMVDAARQLIELATGEPVTMFAGLHWEQPRYFMGIAAGIDWQYRDEKDQ